MALRWSAAIFGAMLYLVWPYYTLLELAGAIQSGDARTINELVDWKSVRQNVKAQVQDLANEMPKTAFDQEHPGSVTFGHAVAVTVANSFVDRLLTPAGIKRLIDNERAARRPQKAEHAVASQSARSSPKESFYHRISYAFFISPIHFEFDINGSDQFPNTDHRGVGDKPVKVLLTFTGAGWQVTDLRLPQLNAPPKTAAALQ